MPIAATPQAHPLRGRRAGLGQASAERRPLRRGAADLDGKGVHRLQHRDARRRRRRRRRRSRRERRVLLVQRRAHSAAQGTERERVCRLFRDRDLVRRWAAAGGRVEAAGRGGIARAAAYRRRPRVHGVVRRLRRHPRPQRRQLHPHDDLQAAAEPDAGARRRRRRCCRGHRSPHRALVWLGVCGAVCLFNCYHARAAPPVELCSRLVASRSARLCLW